MFTFYLVRHGKCENNLKGRIMGQIDTPLIPEGVRSAKVIGSKFKKIHLDEIYSSDLGRAFVSACLINEQLGNKFTIKRFRELRETNYGIYQNRLKKEVTTESPEFKKDPSFIYPEGESALQTQARAVHFIKNLEKKGESKSVLLVSHAALIRTVISFFLSLDLGENLGMEISHLYIGKFVINKGKLVEYEVIG